MGVSWKILTVLTAYTAGSILASSLDPKKKKKIKKIKEEGWDVFKFLLNDFIETHKNPLVKDNEFARMGGKFIKEDNKLYRVSQDCKTRYGYKINIMEVETLDEIEYKEKLIKYIYPPKGYIAFHTLNSDKDIEVADSKIVVINIKTIFKGMGDLFKIISRKINV